MKNWYTFLKENNNNNFWEWFGKSKVVDADGKPLELYHGSEEKFDVFSISKGLKWASKVGFWFTNNLGFAELYGSEIIHAYLKIENPKIIDFEEFDEWRMSNHDNNNFWIDKKNEWLSNGHDGLIVIEEEIVFGDMKMNNNNLYVVFNPNQIKSSKSNNGNYDNNNPNINEKIT